MIYNITKKISEESCAADSLGIKKFYVKSNLAVCDYSYCK